MIGFLIGIGIILIVLVVIVVLCIWAKLSFPGWFWGKVNEFAEEDKFVTVAEENKWRPYERGVVVDKHGKIKPGTFDFAMSVENSLQYIHHMQNGALQKRPYNPTDNVGRFFAGKKIIWLGLDAPAAIRRGSLTFKATRLKAKHGEATIASRVEEYEVTIDALMQQFEWLVVVGDVELTDGGKGSVTFRITVKVIDPYKFWYLKGKEAWKEITTIAGTKAREIMRRLSRTDLAKKDEASGKHFIEQIQGLVIDLTGIGCEVEAGGIHYDDYEVDRDEKTEQALKNLNLVGIQEQTEIAIEAKRKNVLKAAKKVLEQEIKNLAVKANVNAAELKALIEKCRDSEGRVNEETLKLLIQKQELGEKLLTAIKAYEAYQNNTAVQTYAPGGANGLILPPTNTTTTTETPKIEKP